MNQDVKKYVDAILIELYDRGIRHIYPKISFDEKTYLKLGISFKDIEELIEEYSVTGVLYKYSHEVPTYEFGHLFFTTIRTYIANLKQ